MNKYVSKCITSFVTEDDIDLANKLDNLCGSEISDDIYNKCMEPKNFTKIKTKIWSLMKNSAENFHSREYYEGLEGDYQSKDEHDLWSVRVYNCDLLYMVAIANVLKLKRPRTSCDVDIFGIA